MITDDQLYQLAIFLGSCAMLLILLYHYLEVNAKDVPEPATPSSTSSKQPAPSSSAAAVAAAGGRQSGTSTPAGAVAGGGIGGKRG
ncbi:hypothetical protein FQN51_007506 [Onygenales sp. PD_10]|nr:hypothetical protein FQN51_007506 [Onygenales sp. PD_10]